MEAKEAAKLVGVDPKALRAWLRREYPRSPNDAGQRWHVEPHMVAAARVHFAARR